MSDKTSVAFRYPDPREEIVAPHHHVQLSHYYVDKWIPRLGERGHVIVTVLRRMGYISRKEGVIRDGIEIEQAELAALCGLTLRTFQREVSENKYLHRFVQREQQYRRNTAGNIIREKTVYVVQMQDPLIDEDLPLLEKEVERREKGRSRQDGVNGQAPSRQDGGIARQVDTPSRQLGAQARQVGGNLKTPDSSRQKNTSEDAAAPPEVFASLSPERKEPERTGPGAPKPKGWAFSEARWAREDSPFARDLCRKKGWTWRGPGGG